MKSWIAIIVVAGIGAGCDKAKETGVASGSAAATGSGAAPAAGSSAPAVGSSAPATGSGAAGSGAAARAAGSAAAAMPAAGSAAADPIAASPPATGAAAAAVPAAGSAAPIAATPPPSAAGSTALVVGDRVTARWTNGSWYPGKISAVNADGTYNVNFDDGDKSKNLPLAKVKRRVKSTGGGGGSTTKSTASDAPCPGPGLTRRCNGRCVNIQEDSNNCGSCGNVCSGGKRCDGHMSCRDAEGNL